MERSPEEKYRLIQRAGKKPAGGAGVALGRVPHIHDAVSLLDEAWAATPPALIRSSWLKSRLGSNTAFSPVVPVMHQEVSDDAVVVELCSMLHNTKLVDDMNKLAKELRSWLHADADSSERMQQELLYDIQQLLQDEEEQQQQQGSGQGITQDQPQQQPTVAATVNTANIDLNSAELRTAETQPSPEPAVDTEGVQNEKRKSVEFLLKALARAEEALDNADVAEFFGEEAAGQATESVSRTLRRLRRIQRGKQSALVAAAVSAAATGDSNETGLGFSSTHDFFTAMLRFEVLLSCVDAQSRTGNCSCNCIDVTKCMGRNDGFEGNITVNVLRCLSQDRAVMGLFLLVRCDHVLDLGHFTRLPRVTTAKYWNLGLGRRFFGASSGGVGSRRNIVTIELLRPRVGVAFLLRRRPASLNSCLKPEGSEGMISRTHFQYFSSSFPE